MNRPKLGDKIIALASLERIAGSHWERKLKTISGMYIGWRTYSDGIMISDRDEYGYPIDYYYQAKEYFEVWLIVVDPRQNPIPVLRKDCL
jgi:hypothetical protein